MLHFSLAAALFIAPVAVVLALLCHSWVRHPLRRVPGPFLASFSRFWLLRQVYSGKLHLVDTEAHERYGNGFSGLMKRSV